MATTPTPDAKRLELSVSNFGPIAEGRVELRPFTVFVGPSNTGKSYLATLIYALHRFFSAYAGTSDSHSPADLPFSVGPYQNQTILPAKANLSETDLRDLYLWAEANVPKFEAGRFVWVAKSEIPESISTLLKPAFGALGQYSKFLENDITRCFGTSQSGRLIRYGSGKAGLVSLRGFENETQSNTLFSCEVAVTEAGSNMSAEIAETAPLQIDWDSNMASVRLLNIPWHILGYTFVNEDNDDVDGGPRQLVANAFLGNIARAVISEMVGPLGQPAYYLPADRAGAVRSHQALTSSLISRASRAPLAGKQQATFSGVYGDFLEQLVTLPEPSEIKFKLVDALPSQMEEKILRGEIWVDNSAVGYPSFSYRPSGWDHDLSLMNTSSMVSELAPVVLYLRHLVQTGEALIIEEPESALHPAMQVEFTRLLAAAVKAGVRIIITTHSEWILEELANLLLMSELPVEHRQGLEGADLTLSPEELGVWSFQPTGDGSMVEELRFDEAVGKFPSDAGLVTTELYNRYARISNRIERMKEG